MNYIRHLNTFYSLVRKDNKLSCAHVSLYLALFQCWNFNRFFNPFTVDRENVLLLSKIGSRATYQKCLKDLHNAGFIFCHTRASQFARVKITVVRLDEKKDRTNSVQLNIFPESGEASRPINEPGEKICWPNIGPGSGPILTACWPINEPVAGPHLGHIYKLNKQTENSVCNTPKNLFSKNLPLKKMEKDNIQDARPAPKNEAKILSIPPDLPAVETFFKEQNYPTAEAKKFFLYNEGKAWMLSPRLSIQDWKALANKWMLNASRPHDSKQKGSSANYHVDQEKNYGEPL